MLQKIQIITQELKTHYKYVVLTNNNIGKPRKIHGCNEFVMYLKKYIRYQRLKYRLEKRLQTRQAL